MRPLLSHHSSAQTSEGRLVYLTADASHAPLLKITLSEYNIAAEILHVSSRTEYMEAIATDRIDVVIADESSLMFSAAEALEIACSRTPRISFVCLGDSEAEENAGPWIAAGADDYVPKQATWRLAAAVRLALRTAAALAAQTRGHQRMRATGLLLHVVQELSLARDLPTLQAIIRKAARELTGADGATLVLRDGDRCFYADEDAIAPLWKGQRFPMSACVSGWVMSHAEPVVIEDIYSDDRVPIEAYRGTFVQSLLMVPIRKDSPLGAIGNYWAHTRRATPEDVELLQALANTTAVAMENIGIYTRLEQRVKERTQQLELANRELETFSYTVSHDLRSPITAILGFAQLLNETLGETAPPEVRGYCDRIVQQSFRMNGLIHDLLRLSKVAQTELTRQPLDLTALAQDIVGKLKADDPRRHPEVIIPERLVANGDRELVRIMLENLFSNAWKYSSKVAAPRIEFGCKTDAMKGPVFFVRDNGAGFDPRKAARLFGPFQRLHAQDEFPGVGVGLATVQRIVNKHGGRVWAEGEVNEGATFYFTLPPRGTTAPQ